MKRLIFLLLLVAVVVFAFKNCDSKAGEIAGNVMDAAVTELKSQVRQLLEENKLEVVEMKTAFGQLNDNGGKYQFFIAALVRSNSESVPQSSANALDRLFTEAGVTAQSESALTNEHLVRKEITFSHSDFSGGNYYVIWGYAADLSIDLPDLSELIGNVKGK